MTKIVLLACALVVAAACGFVYWKTPEPPPRTLDQAEQEEREIMAGTRRGRPPPAAELQEEQLQQRQRNEGEQLASLFKRCHDAVSVNSS